MQDIGGRTVVQAPVDENKAQAAARLHGSEEDAAQAEKRAVTRRVYCFLCEESGRELAWGTLTGVRPTKLPMQMLEEGKAREEITGFLEKEYFVTPAKAELGYEIACREKALLEKLDCRGGFSLYAGIPFCPSVCSYCSFSSSPIGVWKDRVDSYLDALVRELRDIGRMAQGRYPDTVYIGGGTPTTLEPDQLRRLLTEITENFDLSHTVEFTVEAGRPDSITEEKLAVLREFPVTRISINPQTMKEETLRIIGRNHTVEQTRESFALAREMGFDNINMDLIVGLPEETIDDVRRTMEELKALAPDNVTIHSLAVKRAARLKMNWEEYGHLHMENTWEIIRLTADYCRQMGLEPYYLYRQKNMAGNFENVGYAAKGKAGIYNILIMEEKQTIMALGAGATTKVVTDHGQHIERVGNVNDILNYLERVDEMIERKANLLEKCERSRAAKTLH